MYGGNEMKTRIIALFARLVSVLPMTSAWAGGSTTTYYAALKAAVSETGGGKVYAGTSQTPGTYATSSTSSAQSSTTQDEGKTFYAFAQADSGFEFAGWSTSDGGTVSSTANPYAVTVKCSSSTEGSPTTTTVWANFKKKVLAVFGITFETSDAGAYTADGVAPVNKTGLTEATTVKLASSDPGFLNWRVNGAVVTANPYDLTCIATTTVSAEFLTADQVAEVATFAELTAALANDGKRKITIPSGVDITIAKGETVNVPAGKQLVVDGSLAVVGTLTNSGAISGNGTIRKISWLVTQSEVIEPSNTYKSYTSFTMYSSSFSCKYCKTTTAENTPTVTGVTGFAVDWGVLLDGTKAYKISKQKPKALTVSFDTTKAVNYISSINGDVDAISGWPTVYLVLLADFEDSYKHEGYKGVGQSGTIDCAGKKYTAKGQIDNHFHPILLNGSALIGDGSYTQNANAAFINCTSINVNKCKGTCNMYFFDCGTESSLASVTISNYDSGATWNTYFYSGYYNYTFAKTVYVYGGTFSKDPTSYLQNNATANGLEVDTSVSGRYTVKDKKPPEYKLHSASNASAKYETLQQAVAAVAANGSDTFVLEGGVEILGTVTIPEGKRITIDLGGFNMSGGAIENSGALRLEDNSNQEIKGLFTTPVVNKKGTIDITYGRYGGKFTLEGGTLTTHGGTFTSSFSYEEKGGTANLRGGTYNCAITVPEGHELVGGVLGETCKGVIICDNPLSSAEVSYTVRGLDPEDHGLGVSDFDLYSNYKHSKSGWMTRSDFAGREALWDRLAELRCTVEPVESKAFEATMAFDRPVKAGSISGVASVAGRTETMALEDDVAADEDYHVFIPLVTGQGYYAISYKNMFNGDENDRWAKLLCGAKNNKLENIGTTMTFKYQLRTQERAPGYTTQNPVYNYTFTTYASATYKFTGKGAIYGDTDYTSLAAALTAANYSGTIRLSKDCSEVIEVGREATFTIDANNFAFTGSITAADGYEVSNDGNGIYTVARICVAKIGNDRYCTLQSAIDAIESAGTIFLNRDSGECVTVAKEMSFTLAGENFSGTVSAVEGLVVAKDGNFYVIAKKPELPPEAQGKTEAEQEQIIQQQIQEELQKPDETVQTPKKEDVKILENAGIDVKQTDKEDKTPVSTIDAPNSAGTGDVPKMAAVLKVEKDSIPSNAGNWSFGLASVKKNADGTEEPEKIVQVEENEQKVNLVVNDTNKDQGAEFNASELEQGVYKTTITVEGHTIIDPNSPEIVVQETTPVPNTTIILPIPGEASIQGKNATLDTIIDPSTLVDGDEIKYYNKQSGMYDVWKYEKETDSWNEISLYGIDGVERKKVDSAELTVGTAAWFTRTGNNADGGKPIKVIGVRSERALKAKIDPPASGESASWNLIAIPTPAATFDLNLIKENVSDKDEIEVQTAGGRIRFSRGADNMWGYNEVKTEEKNIGGRTMTVKKNVRVTNSSTVKTGEGIWYISAGGTPTIDWTKAEVEKR